MRVPGSSTPRTHAPPPSAERGTHTRGADEAGEPQAPGECTRLDGTHRHAPAKEAHPCMRVATRERGLLRGKFFVYMEEWSPKGEGEKGQLRLGNHATKTKRAAGPDFKRDTKVQQPAETKFTARSGWLKRLNSAPALGQPARVGMPKEGASGDPVRRAGDFIHVARMRRY
ncbi:hypothetical protein CYMTET_9803, partial [Cymbomonas tetramitiformis]